MIRSKIVGKRLIILSVLLASSGIYGAINQPDVAVAWFTDAEIEGQIEMVMSVPQLLPLVAGTVDEGVQLTRAVPLDCPHFSFL